MRADNVPEIRRLPLFHDLEQAHFEALIRGGYLQAFPPQIELITEGASSDFLHIVVEGSVELFASWSGRETTMATLRPISTFILAASIRDAPYLMSARTLERSRIVLLPSADVREVFAADPAFARAVVAELASCYRTVVKHAKDLKLRNSRERLANHLLVQAGARTAFTLDGDKRRLASFLGMTPENLSRAIRALRPYGVFIDGAAVRLTEPDALRRLARPTPLIDDPHS